MGSCAQLVWDIVIVRRIRLYDVVTIRFWPKLPSSQCLTLNSVFAAKGLVIISVIGWAEIC